MMNNNLETYSTLREITRPLTRPSLHILPRKTPDFIPVPVEGRLSAAAAFSPGDTAPHKA